MRVKTNEFLSDFIVNQYDILKLRNVINVFINIVYEFEMMINDDYFKIKRTSNGEIKVGGDKKPPSNRVESLTIMKYDSKSKMEDILLKYKMATNYLNEYEKLIFNKTFLEGKTNIEICQELYIYDTKLTKIRNSAIIRFCLYLGLDKFTNIFDNQGGGVLWMYVYMVYISKLIVILCN